MVPPEAVVSDLGNPTGDAVVWYASYNGTIYIRCFVPGGGALVAHDNTGRPGAAGFTFSSASASAAG
jgi:hypothetical protein